MTWGKVFRSADQFRQRLAAAMHDVEQQQSRQQAVAGGAAAGEEDVAAICSPPSDASVSCICSSTYLSPTGARSMRIPLRFNAASRPMFDMVVATTVLSCSRPTRLQVARGQQHHGIAIDDTAILIRKHGAIRIAIEGDAHVALSSSTYCATTSGCVAPQVYIDIAAVRAGVTE